jgi:hypothetical protein
MGVTTRDVKWLRKAFLLATDDMDDESIQEFGYTETIARPFDTSPGGNEVINPLPQFTRHADIKVKSGLTRGTFGIGRYHDESYGQRQQKIYMRFGVPEFTPMTQFFTGFYSYQASLLARTGRASASIGYYLGRGVGLAVTIFNIPLLITSVALEAYRFFAEKSSSKFYYFKSAMHLYWNTVSTLVNHYCVNRGIVPRVFTSDQNQALADQNNYSAEELKRFAEVLEIFDENGQVDMYRYASLSHRRKKAFINALKQQMDVDTPNFSSLSNNFKNILAGSLDVPRGRTHKEYMDLWLNSQHGSASGSGGSSENNSESMAEAQVNTVDKEDRASFWDLLKTELDDGTAFVCFRVNSTGEVSESFSNTTTRSAIEDKINGLASASRSTNFSFSGGKLAGLIDGAVGQVKDFIGGIADQFNISGLAVLGGAAFVDIPEHWESSSASLPSQSYTVSLVSPYGNPLSQLFSMYIPLFMILAGALPRSTGKQSYTSPPLVQLFDKGKQQTRLGMIDSVSVRRGVTNLPFNKHMQAMGIEVTFTVKDLSSIMHLPISEGFSLNPTKGIFDEDTVFSDYMGVLAGMDIDDQIYPFRKFLLNLTRWQTNWRTWTSTSHMASFLANGTPLRFASMFYKGIDP